MVNSRIFAPGFFMQNMTDAYVPAKNETNCSQHTGGNSSITGMEIKNSTLQKEGNNCNVTSAFDPTQHANSLILHVTGNITATETSNDNNATRICEEHSKNLSTECLEKLAKSNEIPKSDTVLKYVYKKNDDQTLTNKKPGHPLNSLRKKRSAELKSENITTDASQNAPLIVNYETIHTPEQRYPSANTVQNAALADFNIETLHEPGQALKKEESSKDDSSSRSDENIKESGESKAYSKDDDRSYSDESSEERDRPSSNYRKNKRPYQESEESKEKEEYNKNSSSNEESHEASNDREIDYKKSKLSQRESEKNTEREQYRNNDDSREVTDDINISKKLKDSYEKYEHHPRKPINNFEKYDDNPRKTEGSFEKYDDHPHKPVGSLEKYEQKEDPPVNTAAYSKPNNQRYSESPQSSENSESKESRERNDSIETEKLPYKKHNEDKYNTKENDKFTKEKNNPEYERGTEYKNQDDSGQSQESSYENNDGDDNRNKKQNQEYNAKSQEDEKSLNTPPTIQDVDLGDFSYERVQVNDKGQIVTAKEADTDPSNFKPKLNYEINDKNEITESPPSDIDEQLKSEIYESIKQPIRINGEIKPVVEINSENNDGETSIETSKEALKSSPEKDVSLESFLGTNSEFNGQSENIVAQNKKTEKDDVKQQFERIPKDYKHKTKKEDISNSQETQEESPRQRNEEVHDEGTLDAFSPKDISYDDHLKYKFSDVGIKLPEIKLPEDVLAYAYEEPAYDKNKEPKQNFYKYSGEYEDDGPHKEKQRSKDANHDSGHEDDYYGYYEPGEYKQNLKKKDNKDEEEEDVDLYEKFVRERFGKEHTFEKRSEKLQDASLPYNPKLYETVQNLLKQTKQIDEQAKKSGDPNAGYKWTLEYGENLK